MSYIFISLAIGLIIVFFYYSIHVINRDTCEVETEETEKVSNEFVNNINNLNTDLIRKYITDMKVETRIKELEDNVELLKLEYNKKSSEVSDDESEVIVVKNNKIKKSKTINNVEPVVVENAKDDSENEL
ncbi:unknown similar to AMEV168 [Choristoneura biennis entomopoxvirus]|uniref:Uncharacterized protein n=1 Tax=Choristoneura biennis entomopoxvirus TaxID=10288 RepID=A0A916KPS0_CBEPV|nr:unknown similar to AMEV168 [Choristoneura biennis entomopoxvirus]CCU55778.1 unknown similar to AMEV168 [Choristoneura biennis entomopoxvirus]